MNEAGPREIVGRLKTALADRGYGLLNLRNEFISIDAEGLGCLTWTQFQELLKRCKLNLSQTDIRTLFQYLDENKNNEISISEFLMIMREEMSVFRKNLIREVFDRIDEDRDGVISIVDIGKVINLTRHPEVKSGKISVINLMIDFLETLNSVTDRGEFTYPEFLEYYASIAAYDSDESFEKTIRAVWGLDLAYDPKKSKLGLKHFAGKTATGSAIRDALTKDNLPPTMVKHKAGAATTGTAMPPKPPLIPGVSEAAAAIAAKGPNSDSGSSTAFASNQTNLPFGVAHIVKKFCEQLQKHGGFGFMAVQRKFRIIDDDSSRSIDMAEFKKALKELKIDLDNTEVLALFKHFDKDKTNSITFEEFVQGVRAPLNMRRKSLIHMAFDRLDVDGSGVIDGTEISDCYDASKHPDVIAGRKTKDQVLREFLDTFDVGGEVDGKVTRDEFTNYYHNLSASIDNDEYFELMIRNAWHLSGGEGWSANSSNLRVLVTHRDGTQTIEEVKNDLGLDPNDSDGIIARLRQQGVNVVSIDTKGGTDGAPSAAPSAAAASAPKKRGPISLGELKKQGPQVRSKGGGSEEAKIDPNVLDPHYKKKGKGKTDPAFAQRQSGTPHGLMSILLSIKRALKSRGAHGFIGLKRKFKSIDTDGNQQLDFSELSTALDELNLKLSDAEKRVVFHHFDADNSGTIDFQEFVLGLRDPLNPRRYALVQQAFSRIDFNGSGLVSEEEIAAVYNPEQHPDVLAGKRSKEEILNEFRATFDIGGEHEGHVSRQEFEEYYSNVSASIDNDDYFELMIRTVWGISGADKAWDHSGMNGKVRVRVTHRDGSKSEEDLKLDFGLHLDDHAGVMRRLRDQGLEPVDFEPIDEMQEENVGANTVRSRHDNGMSRRSVHERGRETLSTLPGSAKLQFKDGKHVVTDGRVDTSIQSATSQKGARPEVSARRILANLKNEFRARGIRGLVGLQRNIRNMHIKCFDATSLRAILYDLSIKLDDLDFRILFDHLDATHFGAVSHDALINAMRRPLSDKRLDLVKHAFVHISRSVDDWGCREIRNPTKIDAQKVARTYDASRHPEVMAGTRTESDQLKEFLETFDCGAEEDGVVTLDEFIDYHTNLSSSVDSDSAFEDIVRSVWHYTKEDEKEEGRLFEKRLSKIDPSRVNEGRVAGARSKIGAEDSGATLHSRRHNSSMMADAIGADFIPAPDPKDTATLHRKQLLARTHASSQVARAMAIGDLSNPEKEDIRVTHERAMLLEATHDSSVMNRAMFLQEEERIAGKRVELEQRNVGHQKLQAEPKITKKRTAKINILIAKLHHALQTRGVHGFVSLQRILRNMDDNNNRRIDLQEFTKGMREVKSGLSTDQVITLFEFLDSHGHGEIDAEDLFVVLRDPMTQRRLDLVNEAFNQIDIDGNGIVDAEEVCNLYNAAKHPDVIAGKRTEAEVLDEFLLTFDVGGEVDGKVTRDEFTNYYHNLSASIDNDEYFELMIRNAWHLSGGEGWSANSSNLRVLVTHRDGTQTIEEVKNDLGISKSDTAKIVFQLESQGIDVRRIDLFE